ncbi:unnamed protein product [Dracunculus medinensis]|uniref:DUF362 domain-containing protein n=1 Tax=Dracunculus medinensis TaxID=318479 RepID=A0A0N4UI43_DRAME|nr:unnamed protein product [Dracunculus medinensis]
MAIAINIEERSAMLGIPNRGNENLDFYMGPKPSIFCNELKRRSLIEYSTTGRIFIDGKPTDPQTCEESWNFLLKSTITGDFTRRSLAKIG